jgi:Protein of unknown function (DUF1579)
MKWITIVCVVSCIGAGKAWAQAPSPQKPGAEQKKLEGFVGTWAYEGESKQSPFSPAGKVIGTDVFEMLPGGFFLTHHWDEKNPIGSVKGVEIWAYDAVKKSYTFNYYTSVGEMGSGPITVSGNAWTSSTAGVTFDGKQAWSRCVTTFAGAMTFTMKCDASTDGKTWSADVFHGKWTKK